MIGPRCKRGDALSRGVLIARALLSASPSAPVPDRPGNLAVRPPGHAEALPGGRNAAHRSAALAAGARPVPFRTRKLSRPAPMVLRGKPVGEQGAADRWTALRRRGGPRGMFPRGPPLFMYRFSLCGSRLVLGFYSATLICCYRHNAVQRNRNEVYVHCIRYRQYRFR